MDAVEIDRDGSLMPATGGCSSAGTQPVVTRGYPAGLAGIVPRRPAALLHNGTLWDYGSSAASATTRGDDRVDATADRAYQLATARPRIPTNGSTYCASSVNCPTGTAIAGTSGQPGSLEI